MGYKILSRLADFSSSKEELAEVSQPVPQFPPSLEHRLLSSRKQPEKDKKSLKNILGRQQIKVP